MASEDATALLRTFEALGSPTRIQLLDRLARPAFMADLVEETGLARQSLAKHLEVLAGVGLIRAEEGQRGFLKAQRYQVNPAGLFAFKEQVQGLARAILPAEVAAPATRATPEAPGAPPPAGHGLLLLYGDAPGRWFALPSGASAVIGREADAEVALPWDAYASARHAHLLHARGGWTLTDLDSRNGTLVNLRPVPRGGAVRVRHGDVLTIGRSQLLLRSEG